jgi:cysteine synthase A
MRGRGVEAADYHRYLLGCATNYLEELGYYTWVEQQGKTYEEIQAQWYDPDYWNGIHAQAAEIDALIEAFNERTGLLKEL